MSQRWRVATAAIATGVAIAAVVFARVSPGGDTVLAQAATASRAPLAPQDLVYAEFDSATSTNSVRVSRAIGGNEVVGTGDGMSFLEVAARPGSDRQVAVIGASKEDGTDILILDAVTGELTKIVEGNELVLSSLAWDPSGSTLAFARGSDGVATVSASGDGERLIASPADYVMSDSACAGAKASGIAPSEWSPNGASIALTANAVCDEVVGSDVLVVSADGSGLHQLANTEAPNIGGDERLPTWNPTGDRVAFQGAGGVYTVRPDGSDLIRVGDGFTPVWRPVGGELLFVRAQNPADSRTYDVWAAPDRKNAAPRRVAHTEAVPVSPLWDTTGTTAAFLVIAETTELYSVSAVDTTPRPRSDVGGGMVVDFDFVRTAGGTK